MRKKFNAKQECRHRHLEDLIKCQKNYPFGKKSKPIYSFKRIWGKKCKDCGELFRNGRKKI